MKIGDKITVHGGGSYSNYVEVKYLGEAVYLRAYGHKAGYYPASLIKSKKRYTKDDEVSGHFPAITGLMSYNDQYHWYYPHDGGLNINAKPPKRAYKVVAELDAYDDNYLKEVDYFIFL